MPAEEDADQPRRNSPPSWNYAPRTNRLEKHLRNKKIKRNLVLFFKLWIPGIPMLVLTLYLTEMAQAISWSEVSRVIQQNYALSNAVLTTTLIIVSAVYARTTTATLNEMKAARDASIRPRIIMRLGTLNLEREETESKNSRRFAGSLTVKNVGQGYAIRLRTESILPYDIKDGYEQFIRGYGVLDTDALAPGETSLGEFRTIVKPYSIQFHEKAFIELITTLEDIDGNEFRLHQFYDVFSGLPSNPDLRPIRWQTSLCYEEFWTIPSKKGRSQKRPRGKLQYAEQLILERSET